MKDSHVILKIYNSGMLDDYADDDECLRILLETALESAGVLQDIKDISIGEPVPATEIGRIFKIRLSLLSRGRSKKSTAVKQLVDYCDKYPNANIMGASFDCLAASYDVFCGVRDPELDVICAIAGKPVPAYAKGKG
ncbi:MAG: hypothetical protein GY751_23105 [Bacteroidetes bacterium]|nr:hypothetical protein [Bacteroidota bacterium]